MHHSAPATGFRRYCATYAAALAVALIVIPAAINYAIDPWQYFRKAPYQPELSANARYQNPGLARYYDYDSIVLGSSQTANFYPAALRDALGFEAIRLAIAGGTPYEQRLLLDMAVRRGTLKHVLWGIDVENFGGPVDRVYSGTGPFPWHMYDHAPWSVARYLVNGENLRASMRILRDLRQRLAVDGVDALESLGTWDKVGKFGRGQVIASYLNAPQISGAESMNGDAELDGMKKSFAANVLAPIDAAPNIDFVVFLPPVSILNWKAIRERHPTTYEPLMQFAAHVRRELVVRDNVRLFDFQDLTEITFDLDRYMDLRHYAGDVNRYIVDSIAANRHRVPASDPTAAVMRLRQQVSGYRLPETSGVPR